MNFLWYTYDHVPSPYLCHFALKVYLSQTKTLHVKFELLYFACFLRGIRLESELS